MKKKTPREYAKLVLKNSNGLSLISVTIAAGLVGVIAIFVMRMQENQLKTQNDILIRSEINTFMQKLNFYFSNHLYCQINFTDKKVVPDGSESIEKVLSPKGQVIYEVGKKYGSGSFRLNSLTQKDFYYDTDDKKSGLLTLNVSLERAKKSFGSKVINKKLEVYLYLNDSGQTVGCGNSPPSLVIDPKGDLKVDVKDVQKILTNKPTDKEQEKKLEDLQKIIDSNPNLKMLQESMREMQKMNKQLEENLKQYD